MDKPVHIYQSFIRATLQDVWDAIINPEQTVRYFYGTTVKSDWEVGSPMTYTYPDGTLASEGHIISIDPPKRLEFTFQALWDEDLKAEGPVREIWALAEVNGVIRLTIEMYDIAEDSKTVTEFTQGFPYIVGGLKTLVETGNGFPQPS